jgi:hypothetical protein
MFKVDDEYTALKIGQRNWWSLSGNGMTEDSSAVRRAWMTALAVDSVETPPTVPHVQHALVIAALMRAQPKLIML